MPEVSEFVSIGSERPLGFSLCGEQFRFRGVTPRQYSAWLGETPEALQEEEESPDVIITWEALCERADELVLIGLYEEDHERYKALRSGELNGAPVPTVQQVIALRNWIMEVETGRPPLSATPSSVGHTESSEASSTDESSPEEETPDA